MQNSRKPGPNVLRFSLLIFLICLLFTVLLWDRYFNSDSPLDRQLTSNLYLVMGTLFSIAAGLFTWSLESSRTYLEKEVARRTDELEKRNHALQQVMGEVRILRGFLPICAGCKKIRNDQGYWENLEDYIQSHSEAEFSHGLCKECISRIYPDKRA
ncbi:MAG TPA: hypothetical protein VL688_13175 [Verrucomicrobiae bacterium]|nr:hypothetical protein [Verrucomicrobiae bacterium]